MGDTIPSGSSDDCADDDSFDSNYNNDDDDDSFDSNNNDGNVKNDDIDNCDDIDKATNGGVSSSTTTTGSASASTNTTSTTTTTDVNHKCSNHHHHVDLFHYTADKLLVDQCLTHYEILNVPVHSSQHDIKKAYRKCSLKYHPDKTGRGDDDYVFLAVKAAYDTLFDHAKRQGYDSTVLPFDDSIPPARATLLQQQQQQQSSDNTSSLQLYKDEDFYDTFGPVFLRNLRFDARLRPDLGNNSNSSSSNGSSSKSSGSFNKKNNNGGSTKPKEPPVLGDAATGLDQVHTFYEYWIHFESWRDFSAQAADELKVGEHELENAESRFEKRWIQKEIDKRARILKRAEMARVQQLVERAMECDPRLRRERQEQVQAKERAAAERARLKENEALEAAAAAERRAAEEEELKAQRALEKVQRDKEKKLFRKARQTLRRMTSSSFEGGHGECEPSAEQQLWNDAYDMNQDVEFLCGTLSLDELNQLNEDYETGGLQLVHQHIMEKKQRNNAQQQNGSSNINHNAIGEQRQQHPQTAAAASATEQQQQQQQAPTSSSKDSKAPWTATELSALAKAVKKYPAGGASRWEAISLLVNNLCKQDNPRTREECIEKYNQIARKATVANGSSAISKAAAAAAVAESEIAAAATSTAAATTTSTAAAAATTTNGHGNNCNDAAPLTAADMTADVVWTPEQDQLLQDALSKYPASMDKNDRWTAIATAVPGKTKKACVNRFKAIREALLKNKK